MQELLNLEEQALVRTWIRGVPLSSLDIDSDNATLLSRLAELRFRLHLKALRIEHPNPGLLLKRSPDPSWERAALQQLTVLVRQPDIVPRTQQSLTLWLSPDLAASLLSAGMVSVADFIQIYQRSKTWWTDIEGLGRTGAKKIEQAMDQAFHADLLQPVHQPLVVYETAIVPLDRFLVPAVLDGSQGRNRADARPFIPMTNDLDAIHAWLSLLDKDSHTYRGYQREAERLLLWAIMARQKAFSSLDVTDMAEYRQFLKSPSPADQWVGPPQKKGHPDWRPLTGPMSLRSIRHAEAILRGLFNFLVQQRYLLHNPLLALAKLKPPKSEMVLGVHRAFTSEQWTLMSEVADVFIQQNTGRAQRKGLRTRLVLHLAYATGLRLHELTQLTVADLHMITRKSHTQHWLSVLGKGNKLREVPLPPALFTLVCDAYQTLTGKVLMRQPPSHPLIPDLHNPTKALTPVALHKIMKSFFALAAQHALIHDPDSAAHLAMASTHWLRHTHGSVAAENNIPLTMIRDNLGHATLATTSIYLHADEDARYAAFKHFVEPLPPKT